MTEMTAADIVTEAQNTLRQVLEESVPEAVEEVLMRVAALRYSGDVEGYLTAITTVAADVVTPLLQAKLDAARAEAETWRAKADDADAQFAKCLRECEECEEFRQMKTPKRLQ